MSNKEWPTWVIYLILVVTSPIPIFYIFLLGKVLLKTQLFLWKKTIFWTLVFVYNSILLILTFRPAFRTYLARLLKTTQEVNPVSIIMGKILADITFYLAAFKVFRT